MRNGFLWLCGLCGSSILPVLMFSLYTARVGDGVAGQSRPTTAPATTRPADAIIAEWHFVDGSRGYDFPEPYKPVQVYERRPLVRIYGNGRVLMSGDLVLGGGEIIEGKLSPEELERLKSSLANFIHGIEARELQFSIMQDFPWHEIKIHLGEGREAKLATSTRVYELEVWDEPSLFSWRKNEFWHPRLEDPDNANRYQAAQTRPAKFLAHRMIWTELEAEILRAAAQSMLPNVQPRPPIRSRPSPRE